MIAPREDVKTMKTESRGFILLTSYLLLSVIVLFSIALFTRGSVFLRTAERNKKKVIAFNMAEAGFDTAFRQLKNNAIAQFPWSSGYVSLNTGNMEGGYSANVSDMGNNIRQIKVTGYSPTQVVTPQSQEIRTVVGYTQPGSTSPFNYAVFAKDNVQMSGNAQTDSYNSANGAYNPLTAGSRGDMGTNSTHGGTVQLSGNVQVKGNAVVGTGGNPNNVITMSGNSQITGTQSAATSPLSLPPATTTATLEGQLTISGNTTYMLPAGTHHFSSLSITGNARLVPMGPVKIYVDGDIKISGNGVATVNNVPANTLIYATQDEEVSISGNGNLYAGVYAPNSEVSNTGNGQLFGAMVSKTYHQSGNGKIHFDEALKQVAGGVGTGLQVLSWQETDKTAA